jgi:hypothetical protein
VKEGAPREDPAEAPVAIERPPPLALMAALAALVDLFWNRVAVRLVADDDTGIAMMRAGVFPRNLAAVAGLAALAFSLFGLLRMAGYAGLMRRLTLSAVSGLLLPAFLLAMVIQKERVSILVVLIALGMANALAVLVGVGGAAYRSGALRWALSFATASGALVLVVLVVASVRSLIEAGLGGPVGFVARHGGELAWHLVPLCAAWFVLRPAQPGAPFSMGPRPGPAALGAAAVAFGLIVGLGFYGQAALHGHRFGTLVYGALRLTLLPESLGALYAVSAGVAVAVTVAGLASGSPARAQVGAAVALWLAAGYAPRAPGQLLDFALAVVLLARAAQAADPRGRERARYQWGPLVPAERDARSAADEDPPAA